MTGANRRRVRPCLTSGRSSHGTRRLTATSITRIAVPSLVVVAACGAALAFGILHLRREPPAESKSATAAPVVVPAPAARNDGPAALATAQSEAGTLAAALAAPAVVPDADPS